MCILFLCRFPIFISIILLMKNKNTMLITCRRNAWQKCLWMLFLHFDEHFARFKQISTIPPAIIPKRSRFCTKWNQIKNTFPLLQFNFTTKKMYIYIHILDIHEWITYTNVNRIRSRITNWTFYVRN